MPGAPSGPFDCQFGQPTFAKATCNGQVAPLAATHFLRVHARCPDRVEGASLLPRADNCCYAANPANPQREWNHRQHKVASDRAFKFREGR